MTVFVSILTPKWMLTVLVLSCFVIGILPAQTKMQIRDFELKDATNKTFRLSEHRGEVLVLSFIPDMDSKKTNSYWLGESRRWMKAVRQKFGDSLTIVGLKEMTDLPMFLPKSFVRAKLRKEPFPYLIDWKGNVFDKFSVGKKFALIVIDQQGQVAYRTSEPFSAEKCKEVCAAIEKIKRHSG